ncbi:Rho GTPase activating protein 24 [Balamuthia mandrillaris]
MAEEEGALLLQVRYTKAYTTADVKAVRKMRFNGSWMVQQAIAVFAKENKIREPEMYSFYVPGADERTLGVWLSMNSTLGEHNLRNLDIIELKKHPYIICFGLWTDLGDTTPPWSVPKAFTGQLPSQLRIEMDFSDSLRHLVPVLQELLPLKKGEEYIFQYLFNEDGVTKRKFLNINTSLVDQGIEPKSLLLLTAVSLFTKRTINSLPEGLKSGFLTKQSIKAGTLTPLKKRWFVLEDNLLYYWAAKNEGGSLVLSRDSLKLRHLANAPSGIIALEYCTISELHTDEKGGFTFELHSKAADSFSGKQYTYILSDENEANVREWMKFLRYKCANVSDRRIFEMPLDKVVRRGELPSVVEKTVAYLMKNGLDVEGIFRKSGGMISVQKYRDAFDAGQDPDLNECGDPHTIAGLLKLYLRTLPEPLMTYALYPDFQQAIESSSWSSPSSGASMSSSTEAKEAQKEQEAVVDEETLQKFRALIKQLPLINRKLLAFLIAFLCEVAKYSQVNFMHLSNLATVFGPNILSPKVDTPVELMGHTATICQVIEFISHHRDKLFDDEEVLPLPSPMIQRRPSALTQELASAKELAKLPIEEGEATLEKFGASLVLIEKRIQALSHTVLQQTERRKRLEELLAQLTI